MTNAERDALRRILLLAMSQASENDYAAGWVYDLDYLLWKRGGDWRAIGRVVGWPLGYEGNLGWATWDEATLHYTSTTARGRYEAEKAIR